ncbi:type I-E CRISPR-associated protein Cse1/CasA [Streptomyces sp. NPDC059991]|uniref:type I-E CRISPR-associated protein Cse1/CasA n=1 Tax=Streptomyces sp. NPDC059991 TaxID=3347028 RepID=UPI00368F8841
MDFNLVDDAWVPVILVDGSVAELSIRQLLTDAGQVRALALDVPTQVPPVLRLLLAVLHRALEGPVNDRQWHTWWQAGGFDADRVHQYLDQHRSRFSLFDPVAPFMQAGGLEALNGQTKTAALLVPHMASGNNVPLFSPQRDARPEPLSPAQAARWLLHAHAWDTAAIKTGAVGDRKAKAGKTLANPVGSLGQLGVVIPTGPTLWQTLMCNLLPLPGAEDELDLPVWERAPLTAEWNGARTPTGPVDLYTWPSRRIRLVPDEDATAGGVMVRRVVVCAGDRLALGNGQQLRRWKESEPHAAFKRSSNLERKHRFAPAYWPVRHMSDRQLWRGLGPLLTQAQTLSATAGKDAALHQAPRVLSRLGSSVRMAAWGSTPLQILAVGLEYGNQSAVVTEAYGDTLPLPVAVFSAQDSTWRDAVLDTVEGTARAVTALGFLAHNLAVAAGCRPEEEDLLAGHRSRAREQTYAALDAPFRRWLAALTPQTEPETAQDAWARQVRQIVRSHAGALIDAASPAAWRGREIGDGDDKQRIDATVAELRFHSALNKALAELEAPTDPSLPPVAEQAELEAITP